MDTTVRSFSESERLTVAQPMSEIEIIEIQTLATDRETGALHAGRPWSEQTRLISLH